ncbi:MAG: sulfatase-like hydrolase/transferase, partial [Maribacter dokdonensis]
MKKVFKILMFALVLSSLACNEKSTDAIEEKKQPNIIFIMADDHTTQGLGVYGSRLASLNPTPTLDKLANEGMLMENVFVNNSICVPSRAAIIS